MKKLFVLVSIFILFAFALYLFSATSRQNYFGKAINGQSKEVKLLFVGDIMLSRGVENVIYKEQDPLYPFLRTADFTRNADISFANFENPVSRLGNNVGSIYSFRANPDFLKGLTFAGFDIVSIANNHTFDWGKDAFLDTIKNLKENDILPVGGGLNISLARTPVVVERNNTKVAYLAYSQFAGTPQSNDIPAVAPLNLDYIKEDVAHARNVANIVVVSLHWGEEYATTSLQYQKDIAHQIIDSGADIVVGHHPHVIEEVEKYHKGLIAYSLGNFVFDQNFSADTKTGLVLIVNVNKDKIVDYSTRVVKFTDSFQPYLDDGTLNES